MDLDPWLFSINIFNYLFLLVLYSIMNQKLMNFSHLKLDNYLFKPYYLIISNFPAQFKNHVQFLIVQRYNLCIHPQLFKLFL